MRRKYPKSSLKVLISLYFAEGLSVREINLITGEKLNQTISYLLKKGRIKHDKGYFLTKEGERYLFEHLPKEFSKAMRS